MKAFFLALKYSEINQLKADGWNTDTIQKYDRYVFRKSQQNARYLKTGSPSGRDRHLSKVYAAEWEFEAQHGQGKQFNTIEEVQKFCDRVTQSKTWRKFHSKVDFVEVKKKRETNSSRGFIALAEKKNGVHIITISSKAFNTYTILHELSHVAGYWHHDLGFRQTLVKLVSRWMGTEKAKALKECFRKKSLPSFASFKIKSPEEWYKYNKRMLMARKARKPKLN